MSDISVRASAAAKLNRDLKEAAKNLSEAEVRYLVDLYYSIQDYRKATANQIRSQKNEPTTLIQHFMHEFNSLEYNIKIAMDIYTNQHPIGLWMKGIVGIGPVIAAGLLCHINIEKAPTVGHIWAYAGLDPTRKWEKKKKRPWNASLKTLCWKIGQSFVKVSGKDDAYYGHVYLRRKEYEQKKNELGDYAEQAAVGAKRVKPTTESYKSYSIGKLPAGHINARASRYAVKLFLSHLHGEWYRYHFGTEPPLPYPIAQANR